MAETKEILELRNRIKARKPRFIMQDSWKRKELPKKWRKPKGLHSKMRMRKKGHPKMVSPGFGSPRAVKGFSREGLKIRHVSSLNELEKAENEAIMLSGTIGEKKKIRLVNEAVKKGIKIMNMPEPEKYLAAIEERKKKEKAEKDKRLLKKETAKKETGKKAEKKAELEEALSEEEKKKIEKKEQEKVLIKRD